jgi:hypothetical protein
MLTIEPRTLTMEAWRLKMEPWTVYRPVVADFYHFDEEQDPVPHWSEKLYKDPHKSTIESWFLRACIP